MAVDDLHGLWSVRGRRALIVSGLGWLTGKRRYHRRVSASCAACFSVASDGTGIPRVDYASRLADARV